MNSFTLIFSLLLPIIIIINNNRNNEKSFKKILAIIIIICILIGTSYLKNYVLNPKLVLKKYAISDIKEKYNDYKSIKHIETAKCHELDGEMTVSIKNCYTSKYKLTTDSKEFYIYISNHKHTIEGIKHRDVDIYYAETKECIEHIKYMGKLNDLYGEYRSDEESYSQCAVKLN